MGGVTADGDMGGVAILADIEVAGAWVGLTGVGCAVGVAVAAMAGAMVMDVSGVPAGVAAVGSGPWMAGSFGGSAAAVAIGIVAHVRPL